jgi:hypothetical protein
LYTTRKANVHKLFRFAERRDAPVFTGASLVVPDREPVLH